MACDKIKVRNRLGARATVSFRSTEALAPNALSPQSLRINGDQNAHLDFRTSLLTRSQTVSHKSTHNARPPRTNSKAIQNAFYA